MQIITFFERTFEQSQKPKWNYVSYKEATLSDTHYFRDVIHDNSLRALCLFLMRSILALQKFDEDIRAIIASALS